jgi:hypothetical protein
MPNQLVKAGEGRVDFERCVLLCFENKELVAEFNRLTGSSLGIDRRSVIERLIDQTCGHEPPAIDEQAARRFIKFV